VNKDDHNAYSYQMIWISVFARIDINTHTGTEAAERDTCFANITSGALVIISLR